MIQDKGKQLVRLSGPNVANKSVFGRAEFWYPHQINGYAVETRQLHIMYLKTWPTLCRIKSVNIIYTFSIKEIKHIYYICFSIFHY